MSLDEYEPTVESLFRHRLAVENKKLEEMKAAIVGEVMRLKEKKEEE